MTSSKQYITIALILLCFGCDESSSTPTTSPIDDLLSQMGPSYYNRVYVGNCYEASQIHAFADDRMCTSDIQSKLSDAVLRIELSRNIDGTYFITSDSIKSDTPDPLRSVLSIGDKHNKYKAISGTVTIKDSTAIIDATVKYSPKQQMICSSDGKCICYPNSDNSFEKSECDSDMNDKSYPLNLTLPLVFCEHMDTVAAVDFDVCP